jgi:NAD(P)H-hydrate epimerase
LKVTALVLAGTDRISGDALINLEIIKRIGLEIKVASDYEAWSRISSCLEECDYIIDGILGTGLNSPVKGFFGSVIQDINKSGKPITAIDIPSGLNTDTGQVMGFAVKAELTVTFGFPKLGQLLFPGADLVGRLVRVDIGIPKIVADRVNSGCRMIEPDAFNDLIYEGKDDIHKGTRGHLLVLAGSTGKTGAATLTALGALRAGAGLVTLGIPGSLNNVLETKVTEGMTEPLPETADGSLSLEARASILTLLEGKTALAIGPGLSTNPETSALVRGIISECGLPVVIDADGLNALAEEGSVLKKLDEKMILTPHPGEMGRLTGLSSKEIQVDRVGVAARFAEKYGCFLVLKGARTLLAEPTGMIYLNPTGNPSLSSGGSGDVLTGLIGGLLARGWPVSKAAIAGIYIHGLAADFLAEDMGKAGVLAGELLDVMPGLMDALAKKEWPLKGAPPFIDFYPPF